MNLELISDLVRSKNMSLTSEEPTADHESPSEHFFLKEDNKDGRSSEEEDEGKDENENKPDVAHTNIFATLAALQTGQLTLSQVRKYNVSVRDKCVTQSSLSPDAGCPDPRIVAKPTGVPGSQDELRAGRGDQRVPRCRLLAESSDTATTSFSAADTKFPDAPAKRTEHCPELVKLQPAPIS